MKGRAALPKHQAVQVGTQKVVLVREPARGTAPLDMGYRQVGKFAARPFENVVVLIRTITYLSASRGHSRWTFSHLDRACQHLIRVSTGRQGEVCTYIGSVYQAGIPAVVALTPA